MSSHDTIVIVGAARTPMAGLRGDFKDLAAPQLGAAAIAAAVSRAGIPAEAVQEVIMGCVLAAGQGQAPARQAALAAGLPLNAGCTTINKMCGSGMKAAMLAHDLIAAGTNNIMVAGGMESMTNAPYLLDKARGGFHLGHGKVLDHMLFDGLEDAYDKGRLMGAFAEDCAQSYGFTREQQDDWAITSLSRAQQAISNGSFTAEIVPVTVKKGIIETDEQPPKAHLDRVRTLRPAFRDGGTVTAANSSSISDGAAALVLMRLSMAEHLGLKPLAAIRGHATHADRPNLFPIAPIGSITKLLDKLGWSKDAVDLFEINEAFAVVAMAAMRDLALPAAKVNVHGGACALGHPIGASGARIIVTLLAALETYGLQRGVASLCIGGGEATAVAVERL